MVITDKETENTSETETKKKIKKGILIGLAVLVGIQIITSIIPNMISDYDSETVEKDVESKQTQIQPEIKSETTSEYRDISILVFSDIIFGSSKEEVTKMLQDKDWIIMSSYKENEDSLVSALEFGINKEARFQGQIIYYIVTEFNEDDKLQRFSIFFDVRPEVLYYQGFENINQEIELITENCILYQGYKEHESVRKDDSRTFSDTDKNIAFFHFEESIIEKNHIFVEYYSADLFEKMSS